MRDSAGCHRVLGDNTSRSSLTYCYIFNFLEFSHLGEILQFVVWISHACVIIHSYDSALFVSAKHIDAYANDSAGCVRSPRARGQHDCMNLTFNHSTSKVQYSLHMHGVRNVSTYFELSVIFTDHFSGSDTAVGPVCVSVCLSVYVRTITAERNDRWPRHLARQYIYFYIDTISRSSSRSRS